MEIKENNKKTSVKVNNTKLEPNTTNENKSIKKTVPAKETLIATVTKKSSSVKSSAPEKTKTVAMVPNKNETSSVAAPIKEKKTKTERRTNKVVPPSTRTSLVLPPEPKQKNKIESNNSKEKNKTTTEKRNNKQSTPQTKEKPAIQVSKETYNKINMNDMNLRIASKEGMLLVDEDCCTALNILLQKDGGLQTSFLGSYNNEILKLMHKTLNIYFKNLKKKLKKHNTENVMEDITNKK